MSVLRVRCVARLTAIVDCLAYCGLFVMGVRVYGAKERCDGIARIRHTERFTGGTHVSVMLWRGVYVKKIMSPVRVRLNFSGQNNFLILPPSEIY